MGRESCDQRSIPWAWILFLLKGVEVREVWLTNAPLLVDEPPLLDEPDTWPRDVLPGHSRNTSQGGSVVVSLLESAWLIPAAWAPPN